LTKSVGYLQFVSLSAKRGFCWILCFISSQLAIQPETGKFYLETIEQQNKQIMKNVKAILEAAGYSLSDIVQGASLPLLDYVI
jgi:enamine deaminase RidA (YjgF/YER057c/UK114 family)